MSKKSKMKTRDLLTPVLGGKFDLADKKSITYRKQILPLGSINYDGRKLNFDREYHNKLLKAFQERAYDQVPFVLATNGNAHTEHPEAFRGVVKDVSLEMPGEKPGLYATIAFPNKQLAKAVIDNAELGVSCRIREGVEKADGRTYDVALRHVCGTLDPRVTGMAAWEAVDLSGYSSARYVVDLTSATYTEDDMPKKSKKATKADDIDLAQLVTDIDEMSEDELRAFVRDAIDLTDEADDVDSDDEDDDITDESDDDPDEDDDDDDEDESGGEDDTSLTDAELDAIDLANARATAAGERATQALSLLADERWMGEQESLLRAGIPKAVVDLAEPFLHTIEAQQIDLTNGRRLNATTRMRKILEQMVGYIELSGGKGHSVDLTSNDGKPSAADKAMLDEWEKLYGN